MKFDKLTDGEYRNVSRGFGHPLREFSVVQPCRTSLSLRVAAS
jgi:hypothetical protein